MPESNFNPHTREGCDHRPGTRAAQMGGISIHTPVKGVTTSMVGVAWGDVISIHTPVKGVTIYAYVLECIVNISIHTPVKGVTV